MTADLSFLQVASTLYCFIRNSDGPRLVDKIMLPLLTRLQDRVRTADFSYKRFLAANIDEESVNVETALDAAKLLGENIFKQRGLRELKSQLPIWIENMSVIKEKQEAVQAAVLVVVYMSIALEGRVYQEKEEESLYLFITEVSDQIGMRKKIDWVDLRKNAHFNYDIDITIESAQTLWNYLDAHISNLEHKQIYDELKKSLLHWIEWLKDKRTTKLHIKALSAATLLYNFYFNLYQGMVVPTENDIMEPLLSLKLSLDNELFSEYNIDEINGMPLRHKITKMALIYAARLLMKFLDENAIRYSQLQFRGFSSLKDSLSRCIPRLEKMSMI